MAPAITTTNLGAWVLKGNPKVWDLAAFRAAGHRSLTSWAVRPGYRADMMAVGDRVLFWLSGDGRAGFERGIWGLGHVTAEAETWSDDEPGFWRDDQARLALRGRVPIEVALLDEPVSAAELRAHGIADLEVQRMPQGSNPSWVSVDQLVALTPLLPPWPPASDPGFPGTRR